MAQWNPLRDLVALQDRMNRFFDYATHRHAPEGEGDELEKPDWYPAADVYEDNAEFKVAVDLPGIDRASLDISIDDNRLTIRGARPAQGPTQHRSECPSGTFLRTFSVPASVDQSSVKADYRDGVLEVHLPKKNEEKAHRIEIKVS